MASETSASAVLNETQIKDLTGGDRVSGRRMKEDPWEFGPSGTWVLHSNHRPTVTGTDEGGGAGCG